VGISFDSSLFRVGIDWLHEVIVFDRCAAQFGFDALDALLFFVGGCVAEDEIHVFECLLERG
jgi:hypothetical protein